MTRVDEQNLGPTDRGISIAVGALFALAGLHRSIRAGALLALGYAFAVRGLSGHCPVYQRLGIATDGRRAAATRRNECIDIAVDDSFPASDPPAWVGGRG